MYLEHWGLRQPPFRITPDTSQFYGGALRGPILEAVEYAILQGEGIVKVSGEVGSGKTMLCRVLEERLSDRMEIVYLGNPSLSPVEVLRAIAFEMELGVPDGASHLELIHHLQEALLERHAQERQVVVFIEEAQNMSLETLEEIRLLSNLETGTRKLLQMVLFGQPELDVNLSRPEIRQLRERITHSFRLEPFTAQEVKEYLQFRMANSGYRGPDVFSTRAVKAIARGSKGLARRVSILADKSLMAAFTDGSHVVKAAHVAYALADSEFGKPGCRVGRRWFFRPAILGSVILGAVLLAAAGYTGLYGEGVAGLFAGPAVAAEPAAEERR